MAFDFYHGHGSPYSWRVWLALEHKAIPYELKVLSFASGDTRKPEFVALNPRHQVPTIVDDGFALWESLAILEYLEERFPSTDATRSLFPGDARTRARIRRLTLEVESYLYGQGISPITDDCPKKRSTRSACFESASIERWSGSLVSSASPFQLTKAVGMQSVTVFSPRMRKAGLVGSHAV